MATDFHSLPGWAQGIIKQMRTDYETWIYEPVPALNNRSVVVVFESGESGERELREYLGKVSGYFGFEAREDINSDMNLATNSGDVRTLRPYNDSSTPPGASG